MIPTKKPIDTYYYPKEEFGNLTESKGKLIVPQVLLDDKDTAPLAINCAKLANKYRKHSSYNYFWDIFLKTSSIGFSALSAGFLSAALNDENNSQDYADILAISFSTAATISGALIVAFNPQKLRVDNNYQREKYIKGISMAAVCMSQPEGGSNALPDQENCGKQEALIILSDYCSALNTMQLFNDESSKGETLIKSSSEIWMLKKKRLKIIEGNPDNEVKDQEEVMEKGD